MSGAALLTQWIVAALPHFTLPGVSISPIDMSLDWRVVSVAWLRMSAGDGGGWRYAAQPPNAA